MFQTPFRPLYHQRRGGGIVFGTLLCLTKRLIGAIEVVVITLLTKTIHPGPPQPAPAAQPHPATLNLMNQCQANGRLHKKGDILAL